MNIIVMKKNAVVIEFNVSSLANNVNSTEIALAISDLTGINPTDILVDIVIDEEVISVFVIFPDMDECEQVVAAVNKLDKG